MAIRRYTLDYAAGALREYSTGSYITWDDHAAEVARLRTALALVRDHCASTSLGVPSKHFAGTIQRIAEAALAAKEDERG